MMFDTQLPYFNPSPRLDFSRLEIKIYSFMHLTLPTRLRYQNLRVQPSGALTKRIPS